MVTAVYHDHWTENNSATVRYRVSFDGSDVTEERYDASGLQRYWSTSRYKLHRDEHTVLMLQLSHVALINARDTNIGMVTRNSVHITSRDVTTGHIIISLDGGVAW